MALSKIFEFSRKSDTLILNSPRRDSVSPAVEFTKSERCELFDGLQTPQRSCCFGDKIQKWLPLSLSRTGSLSDCIQHKKVAGQLLPQVFFELDWLQRLQDIGPITTARRSGTGRRRGMRWQFEIPLSGRRNKWNLKIASLGGASDYKIRCVYRPGDYPFSGAMLYAALRAISFYFNVCLASKAKVSSQVLHSRHT